MPSMVTKGGENELCTLSLYSIPCLRNKTSLVDSVRACKLCDKARMVIREEGSKSKVLVTAL